jgi:hypothetical protein
MPRTLVPTICRIAAAALTALYFTYPPDVRGVDKELDRRRVEALATT